MNEAIIEAIAEHSAFGTDEVYRVWLLFKSYDVLVAGCELAEKTGSSNLEIMCILAKAKTDEN